MKKLRSLCILLLLALTFTGCTVNGKKPDTSVSTNGSTDFRPEVTADETKDPASTDEPQKTPDEGGYPVFDFYEKDRYAEQRL